MSPKKWKVQLAATWNSKALKARNATNEAWLMIIDNDNDNELSDYHDSNDNWHDDKLKNDSKDPSAFTNNCLSVYIRNSERI